MFGLGRDIERFYAPLIAAYEDEAGTLRQDWTAEQWERYRLWNRALRAGLDTDLIPGAAYGRHLLATERIGR